MANNPQTLQINDRKWVATYNPPEYSGNFMRIGFWSEQTFYQDLGNRWVLSSGGPIYGVKTEEEVMAYLLEQAQKYIHIYST